MATKGWREEKFPSRVWQKGCPKGLDPDRVETRQKVVLMVW